MTMLARRTPQDTYRRVEFDARVSGADPMQLVGLCYEHLIAALGSALYAHGCGDTAAKSAALTRGVAALTALHLGVKGDNGIAPALRLFYEAARRSLLDCVLAFDPARVNQVRQDFIEISATLTVPAAPN